MARNMPRVAVALQYFDFFPELKEELASKYPGAKFAPKGELMQGQVLVDFLKGYDTAVIGLTASPTRCARSFRISR